MRHLLLYGDIDLNLIDGSAIWLASLAEVLGGLEDVSVSILQKTRITRETVVQDAARLPRVRFIDPWTLKPADGIPGNLLADLPQQRLSASTAAALISALDRSSPYDLVLVRGVDTLQALLKLPTLISPLWAYVTNPVQHHGKQARRTLGKLREMCDRILCQTEEAKAEFLRLCGPSRPEQICVLPPMIPAVNNEVLRTPEPDAPRLGYSGKFSAPYRIMEMLDAFEQIRVRLPRTEFHVVGDKFHSPKPGSDFAERVTHRLRHTPGVVWHGGVTRTEANAILAKVDIAASWRTSEFDTSLEMSTKVLEYAAMGLPVLMNPSSIQQRLFGSSYPAYVSSASEFIEQFLGLVRDAELYRSVSRHVRHVAHEHTFESHRRRLTSMLPGQTPSRVVTDRRPTLLWSGHDFKFLDSIREMIDATGLYRSLTDRHPGHVVQDPGRSKRLLREADLIFCEWCLGNAEWYSHHKQPHQRMVVRLHRQEIELDYLDRIQWENVDRIVFIAEWLKEVFLARFPELADRAILIHNAIDVESLAMEKLPDAEFNLGLLGYCPMLKGPHLAFELLSALKRVDRRYSLFIKGRSPRELPWLWRRPQERAYYEGLSAAIEASPYRNSVVFEPHGEDVGDWFSKIGYILSTSDYEGSHQAVPEGMASGALPVIRNWRGADQLYPRRYVFSNIREAVDVVRGCTSAAAYQAEVASCRQQANRFALRTIAAHHAKLIRGLLESRSQEAAWLARLKPASDVTTTGRRFQANN